MEYISANEFLKQPEEIQKVFLDWWQPSVGDLINKKVWIHGKEYNKVGCFDYEWWESIKDENNDDWNVDNPEDVKEFVFNYIGDFPLLTEGQLRKFIEDKTNGFIKIIEFDYDHYNIVTSNKVFITNKKELLTAYWYVALEISKECVDNGRA